MTHTNVILQFLENGMCKNIQARILKLQREQEQEVLYTQDGLRIPLDNILSINGLSWQ
ncbi:MAG: hypothetical protein ACK478_04960 [Flavobacteriales bacterium]|jgi:hypothetical protein